MPTKFYTGKGDKGSTGVLAKGRVSKDDPIINAAGDVDELNSQIGVSLFYIHDDMVRESLRMMQNELFIIGASLVTLQESSIEKAQLKPEHIERLENDIEKIDKMVPKLKQFVLPGGSEGAVHLHVARSVARRAERSVVASSKKYKVDELTLKYLNRASSYLFAAAIYLNNREGIEEQHPTY